MFSLNRQVRWQPQMAGQMYVIDLWRGHVTQRSSTLVCVQFICQSLDMLLTKSVTIYVIVEALVGVLLVELLCCHCMVLWNSLVAGVVLAVLYYYFKGWASYSKGWAIIYGGGEWRLLLSVISFHWCKIYLLIRIYFISFLKKNYVFLFFAYFFTKPFLSYPSPKNWSFILKSETLYKVSMNVRQMTLNIMIINIFSEQNMIW